MNIETHANHAGWIRAVARCKHFVERLTHRYTPPEEVDRAALEHPRQHAPWPGSYGLLVDPNWWHGHGLH